MFYKILLSFLSALLLFFSWPPNGFSLLALIAFVPLLCLFNSIDKKREIFFFSFLTFLIWNLCTTFWILNASLLGMVLAVMVNTLLMSSVFVLAFVIKKKFDIKRGYWALLFFWLSFEYIHLNWQLSWPWLTLGNVFSSQTALIQWYEYTGVLGGSLWILSANLFIVQSLKSIAYRYASVFIVVIPILISFLITPLDNSEKSLKFVLVQPNVDPYYEKFNNLTGQEQLDEFINLSRTKIDSTTDYLVGPETALVNGIWESKMENAHSIKSLRKLIKGFPSLKIIVGATTLKMYDESNKTNTSRPFRDSQMYYDVFNSALQISKDNIQVYHKSKLVQGVEFIPFESVLGWINFLTIDLGGITGSLGKQNERSVFSLDNNKIAPIICYESIYGEFVTEFVRNEAEILTIITNDGWWKDTPGYKQHLQMSSLRAIESRRSIARCANTGISSFVDFKGNLIKKTNWDQTAVVEHQLKVHKNSTFYVRYGDYIGRLASFLSVIFICFFFAKRK